MHAKPPENAHDPNGPKAPGKPVAACAHDEVRHARIPASRLHPLIDAVEQLPKTQQQFVSQMLETVLAQTGR